MSEPVKKSKKKKRNFSFFLTLAIILLIGYFAISIISLQIDRNERNKQLEAAQSTLASKQSENEELEAILASGDDAAYIERTARDVLGYVLPGERVYFDITSGK